MIFVAVQEWAAFFVPAAGLIELSSLPMLGALVSKGS
jgi:hypothetical protein